MRSSITPDPLALAQLARPHSQLAPPTAILSPSAMTPKDVHGEPTAATGYAGGNPGGKCDPSRGCLSIQPFPRCFDSDLGHHLRIRRLPPASTTPTKTLEFPALYFCRAPLRSVDSLELAGVQARGTWRFANRVPPVRCTSRSMNVAHSRCNSGRQAAARSRTSCSTRAACSCWCIPAPHLLVALRKLEARGKIETAHRTKQRASQIFRYAIATGRAEHDPAGDLRGALTSLEVEHRAAITEPKRVGELLRAAEFDKVVNQLNRHFGTEGDLPKCLSATAQACSTLPYLESALERSINQLKYGIARGACAPWTCLTRACHSTPH